METPEPPAPESLTSPAQFDYYVLGRQFLKDIRGELSQRELSQMLGYSFNQVGKWETGATQIKWNDFLEIVTVLGYPVNEQLKTYIGNYQGNYDDKEFFEHLTFFYGLNSIENPYLYELGLKWQKKLGSPDLAEVFAVFDARASMLIGFLSNYIDCSQFELVAEKYQLFLKQLDILSADPNAGFVNEALQLEDYKNLEVHDEDLLARHSGCSVLALRKTLKTQLEIGTIYFDGKKYYSSGFEYSFSNLNNEKVRTFNKYTFEFIARKYPIRHEEKVPGPIYNSSVSSSRVIAMSPKAALNVDKLISQFHNDVGEIVKHDSDEKTNVQVITVASLAAAFQIKSELEN